MSSEIELAIKIGEIKLTGKLRGNSPQEATKFELVLKRLYVDITQDALTSKSLSEPLRTLVIHRGDKSFDKLIEDTKWDDYWDLMNMASFLLGIGYLYPPSSLESYVRYHLKDNFPEKYRDINNLEDLYRIAREMYNDSKLLEVTWFSNGDTLSNCS